MRGEAPRREILYRLLVFALWAVLLLAALVVAEIAVRLGMPEERRLAVVLLLWIPIFVWIMTWLFHGMIRGMLADAERRRRRDRDGR